MYGIAIELITHVDGRVDAASLNGFVTSYQSVQPLRLGELWARRIGGYTSEDLSELKILTDRMAAEIGADLGAGFGEMTAAEVEGLVR